MELRSFEQVKGPGQRRDKHTRMHSFSCERRSVLLSLEMMH